jgi:hypothetical protein
MLLPFLMLVSGEMMMFFGNADIYTLIGVNIHVIVEYVVTIALAIYIFSFRNDLRQFSLTGNFKDSTTTTTYTCTATMPAASDSERHLADGGDDSCSSLTSPLLAR